jgi:ribosome-associated protein
LLENTDEAMSLLIAEYPNVDRQHLRSLVRQAKAEKDANKPPRAYREIYQLLKQLASGGEGDEGVDEGGDELPADAED